MRFCVLGKHPTISRHELERVFGTKAIRDIKKGIVILDISSGSDEAVLRRFSAVGGSIKRGKIYDETMVSELLSNVSLLGCNESDTAMAWKRTYKLKRFKYVPLDHTDEEIRNSGKEIIIIDETTVGEVLGYQDIARFTTVDIEKPASGMQIGMMPSKLTQILINLAVGETGRTPETVTVYDPFCGFGTTARLANSQGYHCVASDINITPIKQNLTWRKTTPYARTDVHLTIFKQDVHAPVQKPFLKNVTAVATEGWLGPVVSSQRAREWGSGKNLSGLKQTQQEIQKLYENALCMLSVQCPNATIALTYPQYAFVEYDMSAEFQTFATENGYTCIVIPELYFRPNQSVQRRLLLIEPTRT